MPLGGREWSSSLKSEAPLQSLSSLRAILLAVSNDDVIPADQPAGQRLAPCFHLFRAEQSHPLAERSPLPCFSPSENIYTSSIYTGVVLANLRVAETSCRDALDLPRFYDSWPPQSRPHLLSQVDYAGGNQVKIFRASAVRHANGTTSELVGARNEPCTETIAAGCLQIGGVGRAHHYFLWLQIEIVVFASAPRPSQARA